MNDSPQARRSWIGYLRRIVYVALPVVILGFIFSKIDISQFKENIAKTNSWLAVLGIGYCPLVILVGAARWRYVVMRYLQRPLPLGFMLRHYWVGLALGVFAPASVGWYIYRIVVVGRKFGSLSRNLAAILAEKFVALLNVVILIALLYPLVKGMIVRDRALAENLYNTAFLFLALFLVVTILLFVARRHSLGRSLREMSERFLAAKISRIRQVLKRPVDWEPGSFSYAHLVAPVTASSIRDSSRFFVSGRISTKTGLIPLTRKAFAVETKVKDGRMTSSPSCSPHSRLPFPWQRCRR